MYQNTIAILGLVALMPTEGLASGSVVAGTELHLASLETNLEIARP